MVYILFREQHLRATAIPHHALTFLLPFQVPLIPFSLKPWHAVGCHICHFKQGQY